MNTKYEFTGETRIVCGRTLRRIKAIVAIGATVAPGDIGGWIENENNLSVYGNAWVYGDAEVYGNASVYGNAEVYGDACMYGDALVSCDKDYMTFKNSWSSGRWFTYTASNKKWKVGCFYGTGDELVRKAYADSELSGKCYEAIVRVVEDIEAAKESETK